MYFNDLPDDVLALVFRAALPAIKHQPADAKCGLGLLSVCRRWRGVALPMVYDTVVVKYDSRGHDGSDTDIKTTLDLVVDAKCLNVVRQVVIAVYYRTSPFQGLKAVIERMRRAAGEWASMRKLILSLHACGSGGREPFPPAADYEDEIASVSSALAALMPGLREIKCSNHMRTPILRVLYGRLVGFYTDQLQVLHCNNPPITPQDRVFARLREMNIISYDSESLEGQLPRLDPEVVESLVLRRLAANDMWSMFCADPDGCAITFPRLTNLELEYRARNTMSSDQPSDERPWALQFPAAKRVQISCYDKECHSMENAVFPDCLESLDISGSFGMPSVFAGHKVHVSRSLALSMAYQYDVSSRDIDIANRMLEAADSCSSRELAISGLGAISLELFTYTRLTDLQLSVPTTADDVMVLIHRQRDLVYLHVSCVDMVDVQTDFSIPECAEQELMAPLDTQITRLSIWRIEQEELPELALSILKYLLLRIPTLNTVTTPDGLTEQLQAFIDKYVQWYPHLANIELMM